MGDIFKVIANLNLVTSEVYNTSAAENDPIKDKMILVDTCKYVDCEKQMVTSNRLGRYSPAFYERAYRHQSTRQNESLLESAPILNQNDQWGPHQAVSRHACLGSGTYTLRVTALAKWSLF